MLVLFHSGVTTCSKQVRQCLREKELHYESRFVELWRYENLSPAYRKLNPNGVVPTLVHDGVPIINSFCINEYIEDAFPERPLRPDDPVRRARMRYWTWTADDMHISIRRITRRTMQQDSMEEMDKADLELMLATVPSPENRYRWKRLTTGGYPPEEIQVALDSCTHCLDSMEAELGHGGDFLVAGDSLSLADISMLAIVHRIDELHSEMLKRPELPRLNAWYERMWERPAVKFVYDRRSPEIPPDRPKNKSADGIRDFVPVL